MKIFRTILLLVVFGFIVYIRVNSVSPAGPTNSPQAQASASSAGVLTSPAPESGSVPDKAIQVLQTVRTTGEPPAGYVGGRVFENREGRLPAEGDYREFDVDPHNGQRNAERLIVEWKTKKAWYTGDHYQTFTPLP